MFLYFGSMAKALVKGGRRVRQIGGTDLVHIECITHEFVMYIVLLDKHLYMLS